MRLFFAGGVRDKHRTVEFPRVIPLGRLSSLSRGLVGVGMGYFCQKHACCSEVRPGSASASTRLAPSVLKIQIGFKTPASIYVSSAALNIAVPKVFPPN